MFYDAIFYFIFIFYVFFIIFIFILFFLFFLYIDETLFFSSHKNFPSDDTNFFLKCKKKVLVPTKKMFCHYKFAKNIKKNIFLASEIFL